ncbi:piwi-like protein Siwi [Daphnia carinata]|uniref:piwi-like protein Siwi n=1 Tax=Daphnia carinata TaxID=120202 RepID=UPI0025801851|nr:piwi-like protein Siwi [Daphnia carinata]XP_057371401.1 piwi-like protein Siwi [Daphnia carinata]
MSDQDSRGRARGRSRGLRGDSASDDSVRRPREHGTAPYTTQPPHHAGRAGSREQIPEEPEQRPSSQPRSGSGGRASSFAREAPQERSGVPYGRASFHGGSAAQPQASTSRAAAPGAGPSIREGASVGGRGASRFREQRESVIVTRPSADFEKLGRIGQHVTLTSNYFELTKRPDMHLLQYRVDFTPDVDHIGARKALIRVHEAILGKYLFDGTLLYNITRLPQPLELFSKRLSDNSDVVISFRLVGEIQKEDSTYTTVMNIILRRCLGMLNLTLWRRDYYDPAAATEIPQHFLNVWPGYVTTIRHHEEGFLLGVEIIHRVLRRDTALDMMNKIRQAGGDFQAMCSAEMLGKVVMTHYNKRTYRIDDLDYTKNPQSTFHLRKEDRDISYLEYYKKRYNIDVRHPTQPLLVSRPTRRDTNRGDDQPIYLIPELCGMTGLTDDQKKNFGLMKDVGNVTRVTPDKRVESLMKFRRRLAENPDIQKELNSWGLDFAANIVRLDARIIPPQTIQQGGNSFPTQEGDWSRNIQRSRMCVSVELRDWILFTPALMSHEVQPFVELIQNVGRKQGFDVPDPRVVQMQADRTSNYVDAIRSECSRREFSLIFCVLRSSRADTYSSIKKLTCTEFGIPSQVITGRNLKGAQGKLMSIATKVMIQIASKLGAEPWRVLVPSTKWMVVGYDTYHDARQRKAVGAFVASINQEFSRYYSSVKIHENNEEISPSFKDHLFGALKAFYIVNEKTLPGAIIVYRDGVGAGDIPRLKETEIAALKEACSDAGTRTNYMGSGLYNPPVAFIVVSKRINTRFFNMDGRQPSNPVCGTVVDNKVTLQERFDFFLVSQKVTQGTVSPTSYNIVEDQTGITPDIHQRLAYALTHLYYNWPGTLRIPAPIQYAHKLAYLVGESIMQQPHDSLSKLPYYL